MKKRGVFLIGVIFLSVYSFLFPRGSGGELIIRPSVFMKLENAAVVPLKDASSTFAVQIGDQAGFIDESHALVGYVQSHRMAVNDGWLALSGPQGLEIREPDGRLRAILDDSARPLQRGGALYLSQEVSGGVSKIDPSNGRILWSQEYISLVTVLEGAGERTLIGLLDGRALLIDEHGDVLLDYRPGGSRIEAIYGGAISGDGTKIAILSGLDPQRFVLLEERKNGFRPVSHHATSTDFRRSIEMGFIRDAQQIIYEGSGIVAVVNLINHEVGALGSFEETFSWADNPVDDTFLLLGRQNQNTSVQILTGEDLVLFESLVPFDTTGVRWDRNFIILSGDFGIAVLETKVQ